MEKKSKYDFFTEFTLGILVGVMIIKFGFDIYNSYLVMEQRKRTVNINCEQLNVYGDEYNILKNCKFTNGDLEIDITNTVKSIKNK